MKKLSVLFLGMVLLAGCGETSSTRKPEKEDVLKSLRLANDYFMEKWSDPGEAIPYPSRKRNYETNVWTRAYYYEGLIDLWEIDPQQRYLDYALEWGNKHDWKLRGTKNGWKTRNADNQCAGQAYLYLYQLDPEKPERYNYTKTRHGANGLYNPEDRLWWRDGDFDPPYKEPNGKDCYWSRGNGWIVVAMVRMLELLPEDEPHRAEYAKMLVDMCGALKEVQREDGFWNVSLHDPDNYGGKELTGTAMFIYGMAYGVNTGLLDAAQYEPVIYKAWNAMVKDCLHPNGFLGYVQGSGKEPKEAQPVTYDREPDFDDFGLGAFLMAGTEIYKMK